jgi:hypothetical protein
VNGRVDGSGHEKRYWLIMRSRRGIAEVFTVWVSGEKALPVFSFREEAEMYLWFEAPDGGWQIEEVGAGELLEVFSGPYGSVRRVALDPLPEMVSYPMLSFVSVSRERFMERVRQGFGYTSLEIPATV